YTLFVRSSTMLLISVVLFVGIAFAQPTGTWTLFPPQATINTVQVQQPINPDGTSVFKAARGVIPVKFSLLTGNGPVMFHSIGGTYSFLSFTPSSPLTVSNILTLKADYAFTTGDCIGGSLRWQIRTDPNHALFVYYGKPPNWSPCTGADSQSGVNMTSLPDLRYDTSQYAGGSFYDTYAHALS